MIDKCVMALENKIVDSFAFRTGGSVIIHNKATCIIGNIRLNPCSILLNISFDFVCSHKNLAYYEVETDKDSPE